ncbi:MAG: CHAD domain-containing protein, partial [Gammaproteobacteria bacterium]|nr:CHAD domain-containing protein [Gammaproteobacteria bacterium]
LVKAVLLKLLDAIKHHESLLLEHHKEEELHNFRIAVRKTRSLLGQCKKVLPANRLSRFRREFSWLGDFTSAPRDLDVYLLDLEKMKKKSTIDLSTVEPFIVYLQEKTRQEHERLYDSLTSARYRRLKNDWQTFLEMPVARTTRLEDARKSVMIFSQDRIRACYNRVIRQGNRIRKNSSDAQLHELRKSCKKLRYMMEFFQGLYPDKKINRQLRQLKRLQNKLGRFQDLCVQEAILKEYIQGLDRDIWAPASTRLIMDSLQAKQLQQKKTMHRKIPEVIKRYASAEHLEQSRELFNH